jgi:hypothetical protein
MELAYIPAVAAFSGSASGALATVLTSWVSQRRTDRARLRSQTNSKREELYKSFIEEASRLYADALVKDKTEVSELVDLYALIVASWNLLNGSDVPDADRAPASHCAQPASQAARKKLTRSRTNDGSSLRSILASSPIRDRISIGSRMRSMKI